MQSYKKLFLFSLGKDEGLHKKPGLGEIHMV